VQFRNIEWLGGINWSPPAVSIKMASSAAARVEVRQAGGNRTANLELELSSVEGADEQDHMCSKSILTSSKRTATSVVDGGGAGVRNMGALPLANIIRHLRATARIVTCVVQLGYFVDTQVVHASQQH
jgi:hypothetical protein